jgi:uncharacterized protein
VSERHRAVAWVKDDPFGVEFAEIEFASDRLTAKGVAIGGWPAHYRLDYELETAADFITSRLHVSTRGEGWRRILDLRRGEAGTWELLAEEEGELDLPSSGGDPTGFANALDCDLGLSPVTNLMPVLRHDLLSGRGRFELITAWVSVPDLSVRPDGQLFVPSHGFGLSRAALRGDGRHLHRGHYGRPRRSRPRLSGHRASAGAGRFRLRLIGAAAIEAWLGHCSVPPFGW